MTKVNVLMTGVGGQGIILCSDIIGEAALAAGYDVKKTDVHGMAQRGGSVTSHVRMGPEVRSPLIREGEVDLLLAFEKLEGARWAYYLRPGGIAIINNNALPPLSVSLGREGYPTDREIVEIIRKSTDHIYFLSGTSRAAELGDVRTLNMLMLGYASYFLPFQVSVWKDVITEHLPANIWQINVTAFDEGRKEVQGANIG